MRRARIKVDSESGDAFYHLISRTVNGGWLLGTTGKEILRRSASAAIEIALPDGLVVWSAELEALIVVVATRLRRC